MSDSDFGNAGLSGFPSYGHGMPGIAEHHSTASAIDPLPGTSSTSTSLDLSSPTHYSMPPDLLHSVSASLADKPLAGEQQFCSLYGEEPLPGQATPDSSSSPSTTATTSNTHASPELLASLAGPRLPPANLSEPRSGGSGGKWRTSSPVQMHSNPYFVAHDQRLPTRSTLRDAFSGQFAPRPPFSDSKVQELDVVTLSIGSWERHALNPCGHRELQVTIDKISGLFYYVTWELGWAFRITVPFDTVQKISTPGYNVIRLQLRYLPFFQVSKTANENPSDEDFGTPTEVDFTADKQATNIPTHDLYLGPYLVEATNAIFEMANRFPSIATAIRQPGGLEPPLPPPELSPPQFCNKGPSLGQMSTALNDRPGQPLSPTKGKQASQLGLAWNMAQSPPPPAINSRIYAHGIGNTMHELDRKSADPPYSHGRTPSAHTPAHYESSIYPIGPSW